MDEEWLPWRTAMERALYGSGGFFVRERPSAHFRTSVHASPLYARAVAELLLAVDAALGRPDPLDFADMGAGRGELSAGVLAVLPAEVAARVRVHAVERAPRPPGLDPRVAWSAAPPAGLRGLLFANEWLDNVPLDVVETDAAGVPRYVLVRADGTERLGEPVAGEDARWLARWWPLGAAAGDTGDTGSAGDPWATEEGTAGEGHAGKGSAGGRRTMGGDAAGRRAEIGAPRDAAWTSAVSCLAAGLAVAVDYAHTRATRPPYGTLTGYRDGRQVPPVPDGSCDLTAHLAVDALPGAVRTQRAALRALGISGARPPLALASTDPAAYLRGLAAAGEAAELTAEAGLGAFAWLATPVGPRCAQLLG